MRGRGGGCAGHRRYFCRCMIEKQGEREKKYVRLGRGRGKGRGRGRKKEMHTHSHQFLCRRSNLTQKHRRKNELYVIPSYVKRRRENTFPFRLCWSIFLCQWSASLLPPFLHVLLALADNTCSTRGKGEMTRHHACGFLLLRLSCIWHYA